MRYKADIVMLLLPDEQIAVVYRQSVHHNIIAAATLPLPMAATSLMVRSFLVAILM
jgi:ketol-acid reductoisomerase